MGTTITNPAPSTPTPSTPAAEPQQPTMERIPNEYIASTPLLTLRGPGESSAPAAAPVPPPAPVAAPAAPAPAVEQQPTAPATPPVDPAAPPAEAAAPVDPIAALDHAGLMEHFRSQHPEAHSSLIKRLADREIDRRDNMAELARLRESNTNLARMAQEKQQAAVNPPAPPSDGLTPFERSLRAPAQPAVAAQPAAPAPGPVLVQPPPAAPQPEQPPMPAYLQTPALAEAELAEAMASGDYQHAAEVRQQIFYMQQQAQRGQTEAMIRAEAERIVQQRFGHIAPAMESIAGQQEAAARQGFAVGQLVEGGIPDMPEMFKPLSEQTITVGTEQYPDTPMNRVVAKYPYIQNIRVQHADPETSIRLSLIERYRVAHQLTKMDPAFQPQQTQPAPQPVAAPAAPPAGPGLPPEAVAGELDRISRDLQASQAADRARAGINAGASAAASPSMPASERFLDSIGGGGVADPLRGLFSARR